MDKRPTLYLAALAAAGIALSEIDLVLMIAGITDGFGELGPEIPIMLSIGVFSTPSLWMAVAFLACLKRRSAGEGTA